MIVVRVSRNFAQNRKRKNDGGTSEGVSSSFACVLGAAKSFY